MSVLPIRLADDNKFVRLSNDNLDVYMLSCGTYRKLSNDASKEIVSLYNTQMEEIIQK